MSFEGTSQSLPQAEIRVGIATELGRQTLAEAGEGEAAVGEGRSENRERVVVAVDELGQLWVRYWGPRGLVDRHLPMPARAEQIPLVVSLAVGNLVRQEAFELLRDIERRRAEAVEPAASPAPPAIASAPSPPRPANTIAPQPPLPRRDRPSRAHPTARAERKNSWGHYLAGDFVYVPSTTSVCSGGSIATCYDKDFEPISYDEPGNGVAGGVNPADARYIMAYSRLLGPDVWGSVRVGFAFSGGRAKTAAAKHDPRQSKFMPWLVELRLQYFPVRGAFGGALRPFVHAAGGISQESAEVKLNAPRGGDGQPVPAYRDRAPITAIRAAGSLFAGAGIGLSGELFDQLRAEAELSGFLAFPSNGWFLRPSIGLSYDF